jgi:hypothetical protein
VVSLSEDIARHQEELRTAFTTHGVVGANLLPLHALEEGYEAFLATNFRGYRLVHQCFLSLFHDSLKRAEASLPSGPQWECFGLTVVLMSNVFPALALPKYSICTATHSTAMRFSAT